MIGFQTVMNVVNNLNANSNDNNNNNNNNNDNNNNNNLVSRIFKYLKKKSLFYIGKFRSFLHSVLILST